VARNGSVDRRVTAREGIGGRRQEADSRRQTAGEVDY